VKWFFDSNVWVSALATRGLCADLVQLPLSDDGPEVEVVGCTHVEQEVLRLPDYVVTVHFGAPFCLRISGAAAANCRNHFSHARTSAV